jgi:hypothetical protein
MTHDGLNTVAGKITTIKNIRKCTGVKKRDRNQVHALVKMVINKCIP